MLKNLGSSHNRVPVLEDSLKRLNNGWLENEN